MKLGITGQPSPDTKGVYFETGTYNDQPAYYCAATGYWVWFDGEGTWILSATKGVTAAVPSWSSDTLAGTYTPDGVYATGGNAFVYVKTNLVVSGSPVPDRTGIYEEDGESGNRPKWTDTEGNSIAFENSLGSGGGWLLTGGTSVWGLPSHPDDPFGTYSPLNNATGSIVVAAVADPAGSLRDCNIYRGQDGVIEYDTPVAVMGSDGSQVEIPIQALPPNTIWYYVRRRVAACGLESPDSPVCIVRVDASGDMITETPNRPLSVTAIQLAGGKFLLRWRYTPIDHEIAPTEFRIYVDSGSGFNYATPTGTVDYKLGGRGEFKWESIAYTHGQRIKFCVRAYAQGKGETQNTNYVAAVADALGPESITDCIATVEQLP